MEWRWPFRRPTWPQGAQKWISCFRERMRNTSGARLVGCLLSEEGHSFVHSQKAVPNRTHCSWSRNQNQVKEASDMRWQETEEIQRHYWHGRNQKQMVGGVSCVVCAIYATIPWLSMPWSEIDEYWWVKLTWSSRICQNNKIRTAMVAGHQSCPCARSRGPHSFEFAFLCFPAYLFILSDREIRWRVKRTQSWSHNVPRPACHVIANLYRTRAAVPIIKTFKGQGGENNHLQVLGNSISESRLYRRECRRLVWYRIHLKRHVANMSHTSRD
jgi:hypothetical protein